MTTSCEHLQSTINVFIVEDHRCVLWGLEKLIDSEQPRMAVAGSARNRVEALVGAAQVAIDVVLLDLDLEGESSLDFLMDLAELTGARVLILTGCRDSKVRERAVMLGAAGIVLKDDPPHVLLTAIDRVYHGELWLDRATTARVLDSFASGKTSPEARNIATLTPKEREIVAAIVMERGANSKSIASRLNISAHTLRNHLSSIYRKLDVKNRVELVIYARENGLAAARESAERLVAEH